jgi:hypothetical protein
LFVTLQNELVNKILRYVCTIQIRVVNAFRMGLDGADSFDRRSLSSLQSQYSLHHVRSAAAIAAANSSQRRAAAAEENGNTSPKRDISVDSS